MSRTTFAPIPYLVAALSVLWNLAPSDGPRPLASTPARAATSTGGGGVDPADPVDVGTKVCDSEELQRTSCTNPGNCRNACAFWCNSARECRSCCQAFRLPSRRDCLDRCDEVWNP